MKSIVIYHSITGNTKKIAEAICTGMKKNGDRCDIARPKDIQKWDLLDYDLIGLGSPVIGQRELSNVTQFIENTMESLDGKHGFAFCTHGALPGHYLQRVVSKMTNKGLTIIGWNDWFGSVFYPLVPKPYFTDGHPDEIDLKEAEDFGKDMADLSRRISLGETGLIPRFPGPDEYRKIYMSAPVPSEKDLDNFFKAHANIAININEEKCHYPRCTLCIDNCPMECIDFPLSPPLYDLDCDHCWACEQACPQGAIEVDWKPYSEAHLPLIPPLEDSLKIFEERGIFRRLIPPEEIGWDNFVWQLRHPRFKVVR